MAAAVLRAPTLPRFRVAQVPPPKTNTPLRVQPAACGPRPPPGRDLSAQRDESQSGTGNAEDRETEQTMASLLTAAEEELCELFADSNELFGRIGFGTVEAVLNGKDTAVIGL